MVKVVKIRLHVSLFLRLFFHVDHFTHQILVEL
jgi:hypothetical protein